LTAFSAYKTYATIPPINTPLNIHQFLTFSPSSSHSFTFIVLLLFFSFFGGQFRGKKGSKEGENRPTDLRHKKVNLWSKSKFASFNPKNFLPWVKRLFLGE